jgi:polysaccharide biosynthesis transport protein
MPEVFVKPDLVLVKYAVVFHQGMPEGNFFADPKAIARASPSIAGDRGRGPDDVPPGGVFGGIGPPPRSNSNVAPTMLRMPRSLGEAAGILRRHWRLSLALSLLAAAGGGVTWKMPTRYRAESVIMLDTRDVQVPELNPAIPARPFDPTRVRGEIEVLRSRKLAEEVVKRLQLAAQLDFGGPRFATTGDGAMRRQRAIDALLKRLSVENDGRSLVLKIDVDAASPKQAAAIANAYAQAYLEHQVAAKEEATQRAADWLKTQISNLREQLAGAEERISQYKEAHDITSARGTSVTAQELADINAQLIAAHSDRVQKEAAYHYAKQVLSSPDGSAAAGQVLASPLIQRLREQQADLLRQLAELSTRYRPEHPTMIRLKAEYDDVRRKIADEASRVVRAMADEVTAARTREDALKANLAELARSTAQQESAQIELQELEREADASRTLYQSMLTRFKQISAQRDIQLPDAQILSTADPAATTAWPDRPKQLAMLALLSVALGVAVPFILELLDPSFRRPEEIEEATHLPALGLLPSVALPRAGGKLAERAEAILAEALREIRSGLRHSQRGLPTGVVLVTSAVEGEGKSFFSVVLGRSVVRARLRCLVIDCNFQRPGLDKLLVPAPSQGPPAVTTYPHIEVDRHSGIHYIPAPSAVQRRLFRSQELFESAEMRTYIERMRGHYDLIVLDAPPLPAVVDVLALSALADTSLFLVRWGRTSRRVVLDALRLLGRRSASPAGIVLSRVDLRRYATYGSRHYVRYLQDAADPAVPTRGR